MLGLLIHRSDGNRSLIHGLQQLVWYCSRNWPLLHASISASQQSFAEQGSCMEIRRTGLLSARLWEPSGVLSRTTGTLGPHQRSHKMRETAVVRSSRGKYHRFWSLDVLRFHQHRVKEGML